MTQAPAPSTESPPRHCPACDADLSEYPYYRRIASPGARRLHTLAHLTIPVMIVLFFFVLATGQLPIAYSGHAGYFFLGIIFLPAATLYAITSIFPRNFRVLCLRCSWFRDYAHRRGPFQATSKAR